MITGEASLKNWLIKKSKLTEQKTTPSINIPFPSKVRTIIVPTIENGEEITIVMGRVIFHVRVISVVIRKFQKNYTGVEKN